MNQRQENIKAAADCLNFLASDTGQSALFQAIVMSICDVERSEDELERVYAHLNEFNAPLVLLSLTLRGRLTMSWDEGVQQIVYREREPVHT